MTREMEHHDARQLGDIRGVEFARATRVLRAARAWRNAQAMPDHPLHTALVRAIDDYDKGL